MSPDGPQRYSTSDPGMAEINRAADALLPLTETHLAAILPPGLPEEILARQIMSTALQAVFTAGGRRGYDALTLTEAVAHALGSQMSTLEPDDYENLMKVFIESVVLFEERARSQFDHSAVAGTA